MACAIFFERKIGMLTAPDTFLYCVIWAEKIYQYDDGNAARENIIFCCQGNNIFYGWMLGKNKGNMEKFSPSNIGWIVYLLAWIVWHIPKIYQSLYGACCVGHFHQKTTSPLHLIEYFVTIFNEMVASYMDQNFSQCVGSPSIERVNIVFILKSADHT